MLLITTSSSTCPQHSRNLGKTFGDAYAIPSHFGSVSLLSLHNEFIVDSMSAIDLIIKSIPIPMIPPSPPSSTRCSVSCPAAVRTRLPAL